MEFFKFRREDGLWSFLRKFFCKFSSWDLTFYNESHIIMVRIDSARHEITAHSAAAVSACQAQVKKLFQG